MQNIGIDLADFEYIRKNNLIYVDKTEFLYKIVSENKYYFLSRPRRFGKTLFVDTLEKFYQGKKELFEGLYIFNQDWNWEEHPIIRLDFNMIPSENREVLNKSLQKIFSKIAARYNIDLIVEEAYYMFPELIEKLYNKFNQDVVILIDEYDKPIISNLKSTLEENSANLKTIDKNQDYLKMLYDYLKPLEGYLEKVFITGVSKFSKLSIFSTLNNLIELDQNEKFAEIMGYTEKELDEYFSPYFSKLAEKNNLTIPEFRKKFKQMYNGFRFTEKDSRVYNPFSVGSALKNTRFDNYWFKSGTPTFLIELIKKENFQITNLNNLEVNKNKLDATDIKKLKLIPLLFQTGYLTIKKIKNKEIYKLGYPNLEVEKSLTQNILDEFTNEKIELPLIYYIKKSLINKNLEKFIEQMKSIFAGLVNINIPKSLQDREAYYNSLFYLITTLLTDNNLNVYSEVLTSEGRIDSIIETDTNIYIIEFKANQDAEIALQQIKDKNYAERFKIKDKGIILIGTNFDTEKRNIKDIKIEEID
ncbi:PD-(D/E)XK nuclease superfamily protein [Halanaerobium congolense]|uniref:PD-(D/E)XK nuclease superfamily protein n=1 Tax=Halanaerobium congolense TaxID=54121 RepID=A0A1G8SKX5_9FIRM|nr:AAA family ATPase [Halanaerobium congolense]SDJ29803.1 PD-(D/E)XK nuclease superfamily protein [Halanaerobium congolense]SET83229.1 PD-(D/E)XK nuclease superfamily protein [Halanaerobium congolense]